MRSAPMPGTCTKARPRAAPGAAGSRASSRGPTSPSNFRGDWHMLWKEVTAGFLIAGFIGLLGDDFFNGLFITDAPGALQTIENVVAGPIIAVLSFVCSVGNVPLAAVLWSGGISFAGVVAFLFADLIVLPIVLAYRKYYGTAFALRITVLMLLTMMLAALAVNALFGLAGIVPGGPRPTREDVFGSIAVNYKLFLNVAATALFLVLFALDRPRGPPSRPRPCRERRSAGVGSGNGGFIGGFGWPPGPRRGDRRRRDGACGWPGHARRTPGPSSRRPGDEADVSRP